MHVQKITVEHTTDIARLKQTASVRKGNSDVVAIYNGTLLTMETDEPANDLISSGVLIVRAGIIEYAGPLDGYTIPADATIIDANGGEQFSTGIKFTVSWIDRLRGPWIYRCACSLGWVFG